MNGFLRIHTLNNRLKCSATLWCLQDVCDHIVELFEWSLPLPFPQNTQLPLCFTVVEIECLDLLSPKDGLYCKIQDMTKTPKSYLDRIERLVTRYS